MTENNNDVQLIIPEQTGMPRREFIRKSLVASGGAFVGMAAGSQMALPDMSRRRPSRAASRGNNGVGNGEDPQPPGNPPVNDGPGTGPGNPGNRVGGRYGGNRLS